MHIRVLCRNLKLMRKAGLCDKQVEAKRTLAENIDCYGKFTVHVFSPHDVETYQFVSVQSFLNFTNCLIKKYEFSVKVEYFYPWEKLYIQTNNFEKFSGRTRKSVSIYRIWEYTDTY